MNTPRTFGLLALLTLGACGSPRGSSGLIDTDTDAAASTDAPAATDAGTPPVDMGAAPVDAGSPPVDAGTPPVDVGTPPVDVGTPPVDVPTARCGDGTCDPGESCESCSADCASTCPPPPDVPTTRCGDGTCNPGESCESCRADCASTCPPPPDVPTVRCGDGVCNGSETCSTCTHDCGSCMGAIDVNAPCAPGVAQGPSRDCGWRMGVRFACLPNRATMVGCSGEAGVGSLCQPSYGACTGDPVIRVCPGNAPCTLATALPARSGSFDDQCGTCPSAYVTCPPSGEIFVLTSDFDSTNPAQLGTCTAAVR